MRSAAGRREESQEEGANLTSESREPVPNRHQQNHVRQQHWSAESREERANPTSESREPIPSRHQKNHVRQQHSSAAVGSASAAPHPATGVPLLSRSRSHAGAEQGGNSAGGWEHTECHCGSAPPCVCRCRPPTLLRGDSAGSQGGEPLCHRPASVPAPPAQPRALGWMWVEITLFSCAQKVLFKGLGAVVLPAEPSREGRGQSGEDAAMPLV